MRWAVAAGSLLVAGALIAVACTVGDVSYVGKVCDNGSCPSPLSCIQNTCQLASDVAIDDAPSDADAAPPPNCVGIDAQFCDDFERATPLGAWDTINVDADGVFQIIDDGDAGNRVLQAVLADGSASLTPIAYLAKTIAANATSITYAFRFYVHGAVSSSAPLAQVVLFQSDGTSASISIELTYNYDGGTIQCAQYHTQFGDAGSFGSTAQLPQLLQDTWNSVSVTADFGAHTIEVKQILDGGTNTRIIYQYALTSPSPNYMPGTVAIRAGIKGVSGILLNKNIDVRIDDVVVTTTP